MSDPSKTKARLAAELAEARRRVAELETLLAGRSAQTLKRVRDLYEAHEALKTTEARYRGVFEHTNDGVAVYRAVDDGRDFVFLEFNKAAEKIEKVEREDLIGRSVREVFPGVEGLGLFDVFKRVWVTAQPERHPLAFYQDERLTGWRDNFVYKLPSGEIVAVYRDETERKQAEEAIKESEARLAALVEGSIDAIITLDLERRVTSCNSAFLDQFGWIRDEVIGRSVALIHPSEESFKALEGIIYPEIKKTGFCRIEWEFKRRDGTIVPTEAVTSVLKKADGAITGYVGVMRDITERRRAERDLREAYNIINTSPAVAFLWRNEAGWPVEFVSDNITKLTGYTPQEFTTGEVRYAEIIHPEDLDRVAGEVADYSRDEDREGFTHQPYRLVSKGREVRWVDDITYIRRDSKGAITHFEGIILDISDRKRAEEQIKAALKEKEVLLREIHHRVKNNMQVISSMLSLQAAQIKDERLSTAFDEARDRIQAMALIHETLYQSGDLSAIDFKAYLSRLARNLVQAYGAGSGRIRLQVEVEDVSLSIDQAIPCGLVINELVANALKHAFPRGQAGEVLIQARPVGREEIELVVDDDGVGLPPGLDWRNPETLGLKIVTGLVEIQLGGGVALSQDRGVRFTIRF